MNISQVAKKAQVETKRPSLAWERDEGRRSELTTDSNRGKIVEQSVDDCQVNHLESVHHALDVLSPRSQELAVSIIQQLAEREGIGAVNPTPLIDKPEDALERWIVKLKLDGFSYNTTRSYKYMLLKFLKQCPAPTSHNVHDFLYSLLSEVDSGDEEGIEKRKVTISQYVKVLRSFFRYLYDSGLWPNDPTQGLKAPKLAKREKRCPTLEEIRELLTLKMPLKLRLFLQLGIDCGLRRNEMASIEIKNIDFARRRILVMGKGKKERIIPFSLSTGELMRAYLESNEHVKSAYLFPVVFKNMRLKHLTGGAFEQALRRLARDNNTKYINPHALRHFCATYLLEHGADPKAVSMFLGHADINITLTTYHHVGKDRMFKMHEQNNVFANEPLKLAEHAEKEQDAASK